MSAVKIFYLLLFSVLFTGFLKAQTVLMEQNLKKDTIKPVFGQNLKHFYHAYLDFGFVAGPPEADSIDINYGRSNSFAIGFRYKRKICGFYAAGYDLSLSAINYNIRQSGNKRFIDDSLHKTEKFSLLNLSLELYNRFNFGRRGNIIGKFLDAGAFGDWVISARHYTKDIIKPAGSDKDEVIETTTRKLNFTEPFNYGLRARIGFNRWIISASYRLSEMFKKSSGIGELPRLSIGIQVGLY